MVSNQESALYSGAIAILAEQRNSMTSKNVARDFWSGKNVTDNQVLFDLYHELALFIGPFKGYSQLLASADLSDQDRRRMGASQIG